jgi:hypothetical protein
MRVSQLADKDSFSRQSILPALDRFQHFNSGTAVVRYDTGYLFQPPGAGETEGRIINPSSHQGGPGGAAPTTVSVLLDGPTFAGRQFGDPVYRARATVLGSDGTRIWSGDVWVSKHGQYTVEPPHMTPPAEGETWVPVVTGHEPRPAPVAPGANIGPGMGRWRGDDGSDDGEGGGRRRRNRDGDDDGGGRERNRDRRRSRDQDQQGDADERPLIPDGVRVLQTGGNSFDQAAADALNATFGRTLERREWGRALERLKTAVGLGPDHHGKIWENGDYTDMDNRVFDNLDNYASSEGR